MYGFVIDELEVTKKKSIQESFYLLHENLHYWRLSNILTTSSSDAAIIHTIHMRCFIFTYHGGIHNRLFIETYDGVRINMISYTMIPFK